MIDARERLVTRTRIGISLEIPVDEMTGDGYDTTPGERRPARLEFNA
jgi:hypothetical protein